MTNYEIFAACFPELDVSEAAFAHMLNQEDRTIFECARQGERVAYAAMEGNVLRLLCVLPQWQGKGIGRGLMEEAEAFARQTGKGEIIIGGRDGDLFIGSPETAAGFFEKRGYALSRPYDEMRRSLLDFQAADYPLHTPDGTEFCWYTGEKAALLQAVAAVDEDWPQYFAGDEPIFCAALSGQIASFCTVNEWEHCLISNGHNRVGAPGCVGTVPQYRCLGMGLKMVALACEELKKQGCTDAYIHYTGVPDWYRKLGFTVFLRQRLCSKAL